MQAFLRQFFSQFGENFQSCPRVVYRSVRSLVFHVEKFGERAEFIVLKPRIIGLSQRQRIHERIVEIYSQFRAVCAYKPVVELYVLTNEYRAVREFVKVGQHVLYMRLTDYVFVLYVRELNYAFGKRFARVDKG